MNICTYTFEDYLSLVRSFHGHLAPGVVIGGVMVDVAYRRLPAEGLFDAICETRACLPDAVQLLTPCTVGNGWLRIVDLGRYALALYEKTGGKGIRVFLDPARLEKWSEIRAWFFKTKPKAEQDPERLLDQIREAGESIYGVQEVEVHPCFLGRPHRGGFAVCPLCGESYPARDGGICRACQGESPYRDSVKGTLPVVS
ncbi:MAG: tRNA CCA-pyrophosphorylase [Deltaproteobacteria bacterium]|nr:tRNA CCA-pyrophosphorylase [Deltaproteobacteria bacterium]